MNLGKNVYNLLKRQPEVYVLGLGSFKRNHTPATYDEKRQVYLPPITYIDFDRTSTSGYDFVQYIQQLQLIDRAEARAEVEEQVGQLLDMMAEDGQVKLDNLGHLVSYGESYVFKALDLSGYRFASIEAVVGPLREEAKSLVAEAESSAQEEVPQAEESLEPVNSVESEVKEDNAKKSSLSQDVPEAMEENPVKRGNTALWYSLAAAVLVLIVGAFYWTGRKAPVEADSTVAESTADLPADRAEKLTETATVKDSVAAIALDSTAQGADLVPANHNWQIVIGSHKTLAQAYEQAESYNKAGFDKVRVIPSNLAKNRKKVIWDSYETKEEVDSALQYVRKHHIPDAWPDQIK